MEEANSETGRLIAIGDIHGHAAALESNLDAIIPGPDDTIVTLGDYINRGPDSRRVLDLLIELNHRCNLIPILGNHEEMMLDSRVDPHRTPLEITRGRCDPCLLWPKCRDR